MDWEKVAVHKNISHTVMAHKTDLCHLTVTSVATE